MVHTGHAVTIVTYLFTLRVLAQDFEDPDCSVTKGCAYFLCADYPSDCQAVVSWVNFGDSVAFTLRGRTDYDNLWFALGFSYDHFMGNDSVTGCTYQNGKTQVFNALNKNHIDPVILDSEGVSLVSSSYSDDIFECTFTRLKAAGTKIVRFGLDQEYYLLFARGLLNTAGKITYHGRDFSESSEDPYYPQFESSGTGASTIEPAPIETTPGTTQPEDSTPGTTQPEDSTPGTTQLEDSTPGTTQPEDSTPGTTQPEDSTPGTTQPEDSTPGTTQLEDSTPGITQPEDSTPGVIAAKVETSPATETPAPSNSPTTLYFEENPTISEVADCGDSVGCYSDCGNANCSFIVSWKPKTNHVIYNITSSVLRNKVQWIAIAFSTDDEMADDDVMGCVSDTNGQVSPFTGWSRKQDIPAMYTDTEIILAAYKSADGVLSCSFIRPIAAGKIRVNVGEAWTIFFAKGEGTFQPAQDASSKRAVIEYHGDNRYLSPVKLKASDLVDVRTNNTQNSMRYNPLIKAHGSLMIVAWVVFASMGLLVARYCKQVFTGQFLSVIAWVQIHRIFMVLVFCLTASGFVIIFIDVDGYSRNLGPKKFLEGHPIIGIIVMTLTFVNPIMGVLRPHPGTPRRPLFNWAHWFVGTSAIILAVINIFFGFLLTKSGAPFHLIYIMAGFVGWLVFVQMLLEFMQSLGRRLGYTDAYELTDPDKSRPTGAMENSTMILAKQIILTIHFFVVAAFATALVVLFVKGK